MNSRHYVIPKGAQAQPGLVGRTALIVTREVQGSAPRTAEGGGLLPFQLGGAEEGAMGVGGEGSPRWDT